MDRFEKFISDTINEILHPRPRAICVCNQPKLTEFDHLGWCRCGNCGDYLSLKRCLEEEIYN